MVPIRFLVATAIADVLRTERGHVLIRFLAEERWEPIDEDEHYREQAD